MTQKFIVLILSINLLYLQIACHLFVIGQKNGNLLSLITIVITFVLEIPFPQYTLGDSILPRVNRVTDLCVVFASDLKPSVQCSHIAAKAFGHLSLLMKGFLTSDVSILILAYKIYVHPILEYNSPVWNPWLIYDIKCIERVQRYFTRALCGLSHLCYFIRLQNFNFRSLEYRRVYCDLVQCYRIVYKLVDLPMDDIFLIDFNYHIRGHSLKLKSVGSLSVYSCRHNFFSQRVIKAWNSLPSNVIEATISMPSSHVCLKLTYQVFVKCIISSREYISAIIYLSVLFVPVNQSIKINQSINACYEWNKTFLIPRIIG